MKTLLKLTNTTVLTSLALLTAMSAKAAFPPVPSTPLTFDVKNRSAHTLNFEYKSTGVVNGCKDNQLAPGAECGGSTYDGTSVTVTVRLDSSNYCTAFFSRSNTSGTCYGTVLSARLKNNYELYVYNASNK